jgi:DNA-directed RNA polymerase specialized sigma subunit
MKKSREILFSEFSMIKKLDFKAKDPKELESDSIDRKYKHELAHYIYRLVDKYFTKKQKTIFIMFYKYRIGQKSIAKSMHISQPGVNMCLRRCLYKLRNLLKKENKFYGYRTEIEEEANHLWQAL